MSGGGGAPAQPSTTTQVQDIPAWEQGYVTDLLGKAQTISNQPYQQYQGPQVAGFTPDQTQAFSNIEGAGSQIAANQAGALDSANAGADTASGIYGAGAGDVNASTGYNPLAAISPYLGSAAGYNSVAAAQPWMNNAMGYQDAAANAATPQGIQSYMSPYTNDVVSGIQNEANQNWSQNIMPGVNDKFVGSGQYGSGRNAQVLGQAAGNFQTGLSANVANALESGYSTAGTQAANQAQLLSGLGAQSLSGATDAGNLQNQQVGNLLNQAQAAGTATNQQAANLQNAGTALGNLTSTQAGQQLAAGTTLGNLGAQDAATNLNQNQALQAVGQQQQQLNQTNLNTAMQDFQNQVNYPEQQTEYLNQIIRGLPSPTATTSASQTTPAYSVSPLSGIGGAGIGALSLSGANGNPLGTATGLKEGGLVKGYAVGGVVSVDDSDDSDDDYNSSMNPLGDADTGDNDPDSDDSDNDADILSLYGDSPQDQVSDDVRQEMAQSVAQQSPLDSVAKPDTENQTPISSAGGPNSSSPLDRPASMHESGLNPLAGNDDGAVMDNTSMQRQQLLALARGMLTPTIGGSTAAAFGQGLGNLGEVEAQQQKMLMNQRNLNYERSQRDKMLGIDQQRADQTRDYQNARLAQLGEGGSKSGVTERLIQEHMKANPEETWNDAYSAVKSGGADTERDEIRKENLAVNAMKAGATLPGVDDPTLQDYRKFYGVKGVGAAAPVTPEKPGFMARNFGSTNKSPKKITTEAEISAAATKTGKTADQVRKDAIAKGYMIQ